MHHVIVLSTILLLIATIERGNKNPWFEKDKNYTCQSPSYIFQKTIGKWGYFFVAYFFLFIFLSDQIKPLDQNE